jgi:aquaporin Z
MDGALLGLFMISACSFGVLLFHPRSPLVALIPDGTARRVLMGCAMALTNICLVYSPWGRRSGAHTNPALTLTFYRLGKVAPADAAFYALFQFAGAILGTLLAAAALGGLLGAPEVNYVATLPGMRGIFVAFCAEGVISFVLMSMILQVSNRPRWARYTGVCASLLVATFISLEAPLSGMSMNPARSFGSAIVGHVWTALWIYFTAPPLGMLAAAALYTRRHGAGSVFCAKLYHDENMRCIFCGHDAHGRPAAAR